MYLKQLKTVRDEERLMALLHNNRHSPGKIYKGGNTLLHLAVYSRSINSVKIVYELLRNCNLHKKTTAEFNLKGETARELAFRLGELDIYEWLSHPESSRRENSSSRDEEILIKNLSQEGISLQNQVQFSDSPLKHYPLLQKMGKNPLALIWGRLGLGFKNQSPFQDYLLKPASGLNKAWALLSMLMVSQNKEYLWKKIPSLLIILALILRISQYLLVLFGNLKLPRIHL